MPYPELDGLGEASLSTLGTLDQPVREIVMIDSPGPHGRRPALVLTREIARTGLTNVAVAPITSRVRGLSSKVTILRSCGVDHDSVATLDNVATVGRHTLGRVLGYLPDAREPDLFRAIVHTCDLSED